MRVASAKHEIAGYRAKRESASFMLGIGGGDQTQAMTAQFRFILLHLKQQWQCQWL
jgi:hypothetical protein